MHLPNGRINFSNTRHVSKYGGNTKQSKKVTVKEQKILTQEESSKLINEENIRIKALENVEQNGIIFIDEIDKICSRQEVSGEVSRQVFKETYYH